MNQRQMSEKNRIGWNQNAYQAWESRHGPPSHYAEKLKANPIKKVSYYLDEVGDVNGKRVLNLLGSNGNKAVCFALLGADVTVVDISEDNKRYAVELAEAAGVSINYIVKDVLDIKTGELSAFDIIILEMGVLHYFIDLAPLFQMVSNHLKEGGLFIVRDYHPFVSKVLRYVDGELKLDGDYFSEECNGVDVAYSTLLPEDKRENLTKNVIRRWTISEVINALINAGLTIRKMKEDKGIHWAFPEGSPGGISNRIPGTFMICSTLKQI
ncbi:class I SAM-dependent methyltransferase [Sporosarcina thermotolerans]|uniref:Class I SAM-dependent methyltransferase n=1 Tax=Sporosarcina thermotolerans TaxID=633404 RepID=A0AAW9AAT8_9BACL|nr:class I SAM-dependent methyltransferase [Sporosarcina thermotolerans]MDW0117100.1 class I SAM-dependent methyltransferase [Sporosarcina thermotolerans]WHT47808.1 class I SAM-dependent methyltransferase [Sporosarcina thermotolerans]